MVTWSLTGFILLVVGAGLLAGALVWFFLNGKSGKSQLNSQKKNTGNIRDMEIPAQNDAKVSCIDEVTDAAAEPLFPEIEEAPVVQEKLFAEAEAASHGAEIAAEKDGAERADDEMSVAAGEVPAAESPAEETISEEDPAQGNVIAGSEAVFAQEEIPADETDSEADIIAAHVAQILSEEVQTAAAESPAGEKEEASDLEAGTDAEDEENSEEEEEYEEETKFSLREKLQQKRLQRRAEKAREEEENKPIDREELRRMEQLIHMQQQTIRALEKQAEDAVRMRHDFRRELLALKEFARSGEREAVERYLPDIHLEKQTFHVPLCENSLVDVLMRYYADEGRAAGVEMDMAVEASEDLWLGAADLGVLLGNLLENGVTAAKEAAEGRRRLRLRTLQTGDIFAVVMGNTFGAPRNPEGTTFASTKADHKGIGLDSIRRIAERFGGEARFSVEEDLFMSCVVVVRPEEPADREEPARTI